MKMISNPSHPLIFLFLLSLLSLISCEKEHSQNGTEEEQQIQASMVSSEADAEAELIFNDVFDDALGVNDEVGIEGVGSYDRLNPCYTVTVTRLNLPALFPVRVVVNFGAGCRGLDGHVRKGKIITEYTGRLTIAGSVATTVFENYFVDSIKVEGTHKITNTSPSALIRQFTVDAISARLSKPSGNYVEWNNHKVITQVEGLITPLPNDDIFRIEGSSNGKVKRGNLLVTWESNIIEPLMKRFNCRWIVKGRIKTIRRNLDANSPWIAVLDFGTGTCDNKATITINGVSHQITLR